MVRDWAATQHVTHVPQGTTSSKKKKQAKLKRVMQTVKKGARREAGEDGGPNGYENFAALHLLNDPQVRPLCLCLCVRACTYACVHVWRSGFGERWCKGLKEGAMESVGGGRMPSLR